MGVAMAGPARVAWGTSGGNGGRGVTGVSGRRQPGSGHLNVRSMRYGVTAFGKGEGARSTHSGPVREVTD